MAKALSKLHSKYIVHRDLRCEAIKVKIKKERIYLLLDNFDLSLQLKKNHNVLQTFNVSRTLAPEIEGGLAHDMAVDIWALGQIGFQLLCCPSEVSTLRVPKNLRKNGLTA